MLLTLALLVCFGTSEGQMTAGKSPSAKAQPSHEELVRKLDGATALYNTLKDQDSRLHWEVGKDKLKHGFSNVSFNDNFEAELEIAGKNAKKYRVQITYGWSRVPGAEWRFIEPVIENYAFEIAVAGKAKKLTLTDAKGKIQVISIMGEITYKLAGPSETEKTQIFKHFLPAGVNDSLNYVVQETALVQYRDGNDVKSLELVYLPRTEQIGFYVFRDGTGDIYKRSMKR